MKTNNLARHGDLSFRASKLPDGIKKLSIKDNKFILAEGEVTGHYHQLAAEKGAKLYVWKSLDNIYFQVKGGVARLDHQEHETISFEPGPIYVTVPEREYDYFSETINQVID